MAPTGYEEDAVARAGEVRGFEVRHQSDQESLENYRAFLQNHEAKTAKLATHVILECFPDWWCRARRAPPGLVIEGEQEEEELYGVIGGLHALGMPLTLAEKSSVVFRLFQDVEAWGSRDALAGALDLLGPESELTRLLGRTIGQAFPQSAGFLDAAIFDASGFSQTKGLMKTSLRVVWPSIAVDADRAARIRDLIVHQLNNATAENAALAELSARLLEFNAGNAWHNIFGDAAYSSRASIRMPLCDRVSPLPLRAPEKRPFLPIGVLRFRFGDDGSLKGAEWLCQKDELEGNEWVKIGSLRQPVDAKLTEWSVPAAAESAQYIPPSSTRTGRVKVRTAGGSEASINTSMKNARAGKAFNGELERAGETRTIERSFGCTPDEFCQKVEGVLGNAVLEPDGTRSWKQAGNDARVVMYPQDKRIKVVGRTNQVRSLVVIIAPHTDAVQELSYAAANLQPARGPSQAYEPVGAAESPGVGQAASDGAAAGATPGRSLVGQARLVSQPFASQGQGELELVCGDVIEVTSDPEGEGEDSIDDRWVYGRSTASGVQGWFPLSHTVSKED